LERRFQDQAAGQPFDRDSHCLSMPVLSAANLSLRRELFRHIGGFDEDFPLAGAEDQDLSLRARAADAVLLLDAGIPCVHVDDHLSRRAYCKREERNARTMPFLVRKHPELASLPYARENRPIGRGDPPRLIVKKLLKGMLASPPGLAALHGLAGIGESIRAPEPVLRRLYTGLLALHLFRGFRRSWAS
jgi:GT2 family glycosyltransferase